MQIIDSVLAIKQEKVQCITGPSNRLPTNHQTGQFASALNDAARIFAAHLLLERSNYNTESLITYWVNLKFKLYSYEGLQEWEKMYLTLHTCRF